MRSSQLLVASLLAAGVALVPLRAAAQGYAFVVTPGKDKPEKSVQITVVQNCKPSGSQLICEVAKATIDKGPSTGTGTTLGNLTYGVTRTNPTCVWFYNWTTNLRNEVCW